MCALRKIDLFKCTAINYGLNNLLTRYFSSARKKNRICQLSFLQRSAGIIPPYILHVLSVELAAAEKLQYVHCKSWTCNPVASQWLNMQLLFVPLFISLSPTCCLTNSHALNLVSSVSFVPFHTACFTEFHSEHH